MKFNSIRFKITAITVTAILLAILAVFGASYYSIHTETDRRSVEIMRLIGENTRDTLDEYFASIEQSVSLAANMAVDSLDSVVLVECGAAGSYAREQTRSPEQTERLDAYLAEHCAYVLKAFESSAGHTNGVITYYYCINPEISENVHGFFYSRVGKAGFVEREPLDARTLDPKDTEHTTWYYTPIQRGRPSWVGPYTAHFLDEMPTCSYLIPIYSTGELIGVLGMDIALETITSHVSAVRIYDTGFAIYADGAQNIDFIGNTVKDCDGGIEAGCEHGGHGTRDILIVDNLLTDCAEAAIGIGTPGGGGHTSNVTACGNRYRHVGWLSGGASILRFGASGVWFSILLGILVTAVIPQIYSIFCCGFFSLFIRK